MKLKLSILFFFFGFSTWAKDAPPQMVRVRLGQASSEVQFSGSLIRFQSRENPYLLVSIPLNSNVKVRILDVSGKKVWSVRLNSQEVEALVTEKYLLIQGDNLRWGSKSLPQQVLLSINPDETIDIIGVLPLDDYLLGVLASEVPLSWPLETLKAQAVASRSYTLATIEEKKDQPFHLEGSFLNQAFRNVIHQEKQNPMIAKAIQAVKDTQGERLLTIDNKLVKAFYHSDCGGQTTTPQNVWKAGLNNGVVADKSCPSNPLGRWELALNDFEIQRRLKISSFTDMSLERLPNEKRVSAIRFKISDGESKEFSVNSFRQLIGFQDLKSSVFELKRLGGKSIFSGVGLGHGVGLCQWGSRALGLQGYSYKRILSHYYPLAQIKNQKILSL
jgi:stage II sporulation protein D